MAPSAITIQKSEVDALPAGAKCIKVEGVNVIVHKSASGDIKACLNKCEHFGGTFVPDVEDAGIMKCSLHSWKMDPAKMCYVSKGPKVLGMQMEKPANHPQPQFTVTKNADGSVTLTAPAGAAEAGGCSVC